MAELELSELSPAEQIAAIYIGYYDRAADPFGNNFWENALANPSLDLEDIATDFSTQAETLNAYPFLDDPSAEEANAFITQVYLNLFNRPPEGPDDVEEGELDGLTFWSDALIAAINEDEGAISVGEIILSIIEGAKDTEEFDDRTTVLNKILVSASWTDAAEAAGFDEENSYADNPSLEQSATSIIEDVSASEESVTSAKNSIDNFFESSTPSVPGKEIFLTSGTDVTGREDINPTENDDEFLGYMAQNPFAGGVSNSLSSADRLDGKGGNDRLYAELTPEFLGATSNGITLDIQPRTNNIEDIDIEARDISLTGSSETDIDLKAVTRTVTDLLLEISAASSEGTVTIPVEQTFRDVLTALRDEADSSSSVYTAIETLLDDADFSVAALEAEFGVSFEATTIDEGIATEFTQTLAGMITTKLDLPEITLDAKNMFDVEEIGSHYSDGDLWIENLTTLTTGGFARNTDEITVTMDHTDNFNSDEDAADLKVLFDNDYLLSGQEQESDIVYFLLDEDAEQEGNPNRLENIDVDGIIFNVVNADGSTTPVIIESDAANVAGTHAQFVAELQEPFQAAIDAGLVPEGSRLYLDENRTTTTFPDSGIESDPIPGIVVESGDGTELDATGFSRIEEEIGEYDVFGRFESSGQGTTDQPITIDIDLHKVGRGGEGGDIIVGGKSENTPDGIADGIEVFNINVKGAGNDDPNGGMTKPSNVGTITSTGDELREVYIQTDPTFAVGETFASLTVRNGFDENRDTDMESGNLELINADDFKGDLTLGAAPFGAANNGGRITNADMITAQGGGDVNLGLNYDGTEEGQDYSVYTAEGDDTIDIELDGDATDYAGSSLMVSTGTGDDSVKIDMDLGTFFLENEQLNQAILDDVNILTGEGNDTVESAVGSNGDLNIDTGTGDDFINTSGGLFKGSWAFNYDDARPFIGARADDQPGVPTSLAYVGGATVTVTLSGAGIDGDLVAGGGVMADEAQNPSGVDGAIADVNGYEASATVDVDGPYDFFGTQVDVNNAVIAAISDHPVLSKLIDLKLTENNTWTATMTTGGEFDELDLRVEIDQADQGSDADDWDAVEAEAREVFQDSSIDIVDLDDANGASGLAVLDLATTFGGPSADPLDSANDWYTGLSAAGDDDNAAGNTQINHGTASNAETDNVITPGEGDDLVVMSTNGGEGERAPRQAIANDGETSPVGFLYSFTRIDGNTLQNGASNETIVFEDLFGDDTIMNFTTADLGIQDGTILCNTAVVSIIQQGDEEVSAPIEEEPETFSLRITGSDLNTGDDPFTITFQGVDIVIDAGASLQDVEDAFLAALEDPNDSDYTVEVDAAASDSETTVLNFTADDGIGNDDPDIDIGDFSNINLLTGVTEVFDTEQGQDADPAATEGENLTEEFSVEFGIACEDAVYNFNGQTVVVREGDTGAEIAQAFREGNDYEDWTVGTVTDEGSAETFDIVLTTTGANNTGGELISFDDVDVSIPDVAAVNADTLETEFLAQFTSGTDYELTNTSTNGANDELTLTFTSLTNENLTDVTSGDFTIDTDLGTTAGTPTVTDGEAPTIDPGTGDTVIFTSTTENTNVPDVTDDDFEGANIEVEQEGIETLNAGLDFLDYSDYLVSEYDRSDNTSSTGDSADSNVFIPVTLDYNEDASLSDNVEANEVAVARMQSDDATGETDETFGNLDESVIEDLFNGGVDDDNEWGDLTEANFNVADYDKSDQEELIGDAKAILKIENGDNLGEYKVFELTWDGDEDLDEQTVSAREIGTQDYGTSLNGLDEINLVGSDSYGELIAKGFADFT